MPPPYITPDQHIELLSDLGYLAGDIKAAKEVGYWIRQFKQEFELAKGRAAVEDDIVRFTIPLVGNFNNYLEKVFFEFRYSYDPKTDELSLEVLNARMGRFRKTYQPSSPEKLVTAAEVYESLSRPAIQDNNTAMYIRLWLEAERDKNRDNDYDPEAKSNPRDIKDEPTIRRPTVGPLSPEIKARLFKIKR